MKQHNRGNTILRGLFVSQDPVLRERVRFHLNNLKDCSFHFAESAAATQTSSAPARDYDLFSLPVLDLSLLLPNLSKVQGLYPVIAFGSAKFLAKALKAGCFDYIKDPWHPAELELRISRLTAVFAKTYNVDGQIISFQEHQAYLNDGPLGLSFHEGKILKALLNQRYSALPRESLCYALWGEKPVKGSRVIDMHISNINKKLREYNCRIKIKSVRGVGYTVAQI